jgi:hypothetical protein
VRHRTKVLHATNYERSLGIALYKIEFCGR